MARAESIYDWVGKIVITKEEGRHLGTVSRVFLDPESSTLTSICLRENRLGPERCVIMDDVEMAGDDVVMIREASAAVPVSHTALRGRELDDLRGLWVTTLDGVHLGTIDEVGIARNGWTACALRLSNGHRLDVSPSDLRIGRDEILVPQTFTDRLVEDSGRPGLRGILSPFIDVETFDELRSGIRRVLRRTRTAAANGNGAARPESRRARRSKEREGAKEQTV
jgi:sporulation protein YlmC with PRC-barrel domain